VGCVKKLRSNPTSKTKAGARSGEGENCIRSREDKGEGERKEEEWKGEEGGTEGKRGDERGQ
jgi:hypothetical protein